MINKSQTKIMDSATKKQLKIVNKKIDDMSIQLADLILKKRELLSAPRVEKPRSKFSEFKGLSVDVKTKFNDIKMLKISMDKIPEDDKEKIEEYMKRLDMFEKKFEVSAREYLEFVTQNEEFMKDDRSSEEHDKVMKLVPE